MAVVKKDDSSALDVFLRDFAWEAAKTTKAYQEANVKARCNLIAVQIQHRVHPTGHSSDAMRNPFVNPTAHLYPWTSAKLAAAEQEATELSDQYRHYMTQKEEESKAKRDAAIKEATELLQKSAAACKPFQLWSKASGYQLITIVPWKHFGDGSTHFSMVPCTQGTHISALVAPTYMPILTGHLPSVQRFLHRSLNGDYNDVEDLLSN